MNQLKKVSSDMNQKKKGLIPTRSLLNLSNKNNNDLQPASLYDTSAQTSLDTSLSSRYSGQNDNLKLSISKPVIQHSSYGSTNLSPISDAKFEFQPSLTSTPKSNVPPPPPPPPLLPPPVLPLTQTQTLTSKNNPLDKYKIDLSEYSNVDKKHLKAFKNSEKLIQKEKLNDVSYPTIAKLAVHVNLAKTIQPTEPKKFTQNNNQSSQKSKPNTGPLPPLPPPPPPPPPPTLNLVPAPVLKTNKNILPKTPELKNDKSALLDQIRSFKGFSENDKAKVEKCTSSILSNKPSNINLKPKETSNKDELNDEIKKFADRGFSDKAKKNLRNAEQKIINSQMQNNVAQSLNESIEKILSTRRTFLGNIIF
jgi:hypothetical protein